MRLLGRQKIPRAVSSDYLPQRWEVLYWWNRRRTPGGACLRRDESRGFWETLLLSAVLLKGVPLAFEGRHNIATIVVDSLSVDWNEQAARSAAQYLELMGFSCSGLIDQLSSDAGEQYTRSQAEYGARRAGAC